jgi:hypothetical protein
MNTKCLLGWRTAKFPALLVGPALATVGLLASAGPSFAVTDLTFSLVDQPGQSDTSESLAFVATGSFEILRIAGYQVPSFEQSTGNGVFLGGIGPNLLGSTWHFTPAGSGSLANQFNDGTSVNGLNFGGVTVGSFDTFSQNFHTIPGDTYRVNFLYSNDFAPNNAPSALTVTVNAIGSVPEPSAWAMMLLGFVGLGFVSYRQARRRPTYFASV